MRMPWIKADAGPTQAQIKRLYTIASNHGWSHYEVIALIMRYQKCSTSDLTREEYDEVCSLLEQRQQVGRKGGKANQVDSNST